jgi:flagellar hook-associated protein 1 FlgK
MYSITGCEINSALLREESLLPTFRQDGAVNYALADKLQDAWDTACMTIDPTDNSPCTFEQFYDKMIDRLGTDGNIYYASSQTLDTTVASLDNSRQQVMGVSSDEELTKMIKYQAAYNASSRFITVISEMTELICTGLI